MNLKSISFRDRRKESWRKLEKYLNSIESRGIQSLSPEQLVELSQLYRTACSSLYMARNISLDKNLHEYLESLVSRGYISIYCTKPVKEKVLRKFFVQDFPPLIRKYFHYHLTAFLVIFVGFIVGYLMTLQDQSKYFAFIPRAMAQDRTPFSSRSSLEGALRGGRETGSMHRSVFTVFLFTHNSKVGFLAFALGILAGIPSLYLMFYNGSTLGAMTYIYHSQNLTLPWWAWVLPHGITEFLAIILCGGAGLMIGLAVVSPGKYGRKHRLKEIGRDAGLTVAGTVVLFLIAGLIEGFFRQTSLSDFPRYLLASTTFIFWVYYFGFHGRGEDHVLPS